MIGEELAATVVAKLAREVMALDEEIAEIDALIEGRLRDYRHAEVILSMPGIAPVLGAEFIAHTGGDMSVFGTSDRLASVADLAPVPRDSGWISGNMRSPRRYRRLLRAVYMSAMVAARCRPNVKAFFDRKRAEGKGHRRQAVIALAGHRLNVLSALICDVRTVEVTVPPGPATFGWHTHSESPEALDNFIGNPFTLDHSRAKDFHTQMAPRGVV